MLDLQSYADELMNYYKQNSTFYGLCFLPRKLDNFYGYFLTEKLSQGKAYISRSILVVTMMCVKQIITSRNTALRKTLPSFYAQQR